MIQVAVIVLSRWDGVVDFCEDMRFVLLCVSPTSFNIFFFLANSWVYLLVLIAVLGEKGML